MQAQFTALRIIYLQVIGRKGIVCKLDEALIRCAYVFHNNPLFAVILDAVCPALNLMAHYMPFIPPPQRS
jgi:hypothetical protein